MSEKSQKDKHVSPAFLVNSFSSPSYDSSIGSSKASSPQGAILCFLFQFPAASRLLKVIQYLLTSSSSSSCHFYPSLYLSFNNVFQKAVPTQDLTNPVSLQFFFSYRIFLCSLTLSNTSSFST